MSRDAAVAGLVFATVTSSVYAIAPPDTLEKVKGAVFEISCATTSVGGTGFLIDSTGLAVTNFHVLRGTLEAEARFVDHPTPFKLELVSVDPDLDIALVKFNAAQIAKVPTIAPLSIAKANPPIGSDVWAAGFPEFGFTVNRGVVSGIRDGEAVKEKKGSVWIQTDCTINHGNSGGPLLNANCEVVGINTWSWRGGDNVYFALSAQHLAALQQQSNGAAPLTFQRAAEMYKVTTSRAGAFPHLIIPRTTTIAEVQTAAREFRRLAACRICDGKGTVTQKTRTGSSGSGAFKEPTYSTSQEICNGCKGQRINSGPGLRKVTERLISALSTVKKPTTDDEKDRHQRITTLVRDSIAEVVAVNAAALAERFNNEAKTVFSTEVSDRAKPVIFVGKVLEDQRIPGEGNRIRILSLYGADQLVLVVDGDIEDGLTAETVLVGGLFAGFVPDPEGEVLPIVQGGFIVGPRRPR